MHFLDGFNRKKYKLFKSEDVNEEIGDSAQTRNCGLGLVRIWKIIRKVEGVC